MLGIVLEELTSARSGDQRLSSKNKYCLSGQPGIQLPVMDGYETTRRIRADPESKAIPIIAVTSYALTGDEAKALAAGCNDYVTKPYSPRALLAKVREHLALVA